MAEEFAELIAVIDADNKQLLKKVDESEKKLRDFAGKTDRQLSQVDRSFTRLSSQVGNMARSVEGLTTKFLGVFGLVGAVIAFKDQLAELAIKGLSFIGFIEDYTKAITDAEEATRKLQERSAKMDLALGLREELAILNQNATPTEVRRARLAREGRSGSEIDTIIRLERELRQERAAEAGRRTRGRLRQQLSIAMGADPLEFVSDPGERELRRQIQIFNQASAARQQLPNLLEQRNRLLEANQPRISGFGTGSISSAQIRFGGGDNFAIGQQRETIKEQKETNKLLGDLNKKIADLRKDVALSQSLDQ